MGGDQKVVAVPEHIKKEAFKQTEQLSPLECTQLSVVLRSAIDQLALVSLLVVDPAQQAQELSEGVGEEVLRIIANQQQLETQFGELVAAQPALRALPNKARLLENQRQIDVVTQALRDCTRALCRNLKDSPNVGENLAKVAAERAALHDLLSRCAAVVQRRSNILPAVEYVLAAEHAERQVREMVEGERRVSEEVRKLRESISKERAQHDSHVLATNQQLERLKDELRRCKLKAAIDTRYLERGLKAGNDHERRQQGASLQQLKEQLAQVQQQQLLEQQAHAATCEFLQQQCAKLAALAAGWGSRVGLDGEQRERELEVERAQHQRDLQRLEEMQRQLASEQAARAERERKAQEASEAVQQAVLQEERRERAAALIQAAWRGFKVRSAAKGGSKKKGGKAAKGGKKKKK